MSGGLGSMMAIDGAVCNAMNLTCAASPASVCPSALPPTLHPAKPDCTISARSRRCHPSPTPTPNSTHTLTITSASTTLAASSSSSEPQNQAAYPTPSPVPPSCPDAPKRSLSVVAAASSPNPSPVPLPLPAAAASGARSASYVMAVLQYLRLPQLSWPDSASAGGSNKGANSSAAAAKQSGASKTFSSSSSSNNPASPKDSGDKVVAGISLSSRSSGSSNQGKEFLSDAISANSAFSSGRGHSLLHQVAAISVNSPARAAAAAASSSSSPSSPPGPASSSLFVSFLVNYSVLMSAWWQFKHTAKDRLAGYLSQALPLPLSLPLRLAPSRALSFRLPGATATGISTTAAIAVAPNTPAAAGAAPTTFEFGSTQQRPPPPPSPSPSPSPLPSPAGGRGGTCRATDADSTCAQCGGRQRGRRTTRAAIQAEAAVDAETAARSRAVFRAGGGGRSGGGGRPLLPLRRKGGRSDKSNRSGDCGRENGSRSGSGSRGRVLAATVEGLALSVDAEEDATQAAGASGAVPANGLGSRRWALAAAGEEVAGAGLGEGLLVGDGAATSAAASGPALSGQEWFECMCQQHHHQHQQKHRHDRLEAGAHADLETSDLLFSSAAAVAAVAATAALADVCEQQNQRQLPDQQEHPQPQTQQQQPFWWSGALINGSGGGSGAYTKADAVEEAGELSVSESESEAELESEAHLASYGFSYSAAGLLFPYHLGATQLLLDQGLLTESTPLSGASAGAIVCATIAAGVSMQRAMDAIKELARDCRQHGTAFRLGAVLRNVMTDILPDDCHERCNGRVQVAVTQVFGSPRALMVDNFKSKDDLIDALIASSFVPGYLAPTATAKFRGRQCVDGGVSNFTPPTPSRHTVKICAFPASALGLSDVAINPDLNPSSQWTLKELYQLALEPADDESLDIMFEEGYHDARRWWEATTAKAVTIAATAAGAAAPVAAGFSGQSDTTSLCVPPLALSPMHFAELREGQLQQQQQQHQQQHQQQQQQQVLQRSVSLAAGGLAGLGGRGTSSMAAAVAAPVLCRVRQQHLRSP